MAKVYPYEWFLIKQGLPFRNSKSLFYGSESVSAVFTLLRDLEGCGGHRGTSMRDRQVWLEFN